MRPLLRVYFSQLLLPLIFLVRHGDDSPRIQFPSFLIARKAGVYVLYVRYPFTLLTLIDDIFTVGLGVYIVLGPPALSDLWDCTGT